MAVHLLLGLMAVGQEVAPQEQAAPPSPPVAAEASAGPTPQEQAVPQADIPPFDIEAYDVAGNSILSADEIERAVYPHMGPQRRATDVEAARAALQKAYEDKGYSSVFVQIPQQSPETGIIKLQVTEARIASVKVTGARFAGDDDILARVPELRQGNIPNLRRAEEQLSEANRFPERRVTPVVEPGQEPGTLNVELEVEDKLPFHATLQLSNDYSQGTRPLRALASARYADLWGIGHQISATYLVSPQDFNNLEVISGSYLAPIPNSDWTVLLYGYKSNSNVAALGGTNVLGDGYAVGLRGILNLGSPGQDMFQSVSFGVDYKNFLETLTLAAVADNIRTPLDYVVGTASYTFGLNGDRDTLNATLGVSFGIRGFGSQVEFLDENGDGIPEEYPVFQTKRGTLEAVGNFVHLNFDADYLHTFKGDIGLFGRLSAQVADSPLVSNEQFAAGGLTSVRGYYQSEAVGDAGINGQIELRSPSFGPSLTDLIDDWRVFGFTDAAYIAFKEPGPGVAGETTLWSAGLGTSFRLFTYLSGEAVIAWPLENSLRGDGPYATFSVKAEY